MDELRDNASPPAPIMPAYREQARFYNRNTSAFSGYRKAVVDALPLEPGQLVLDIGSGTGLCAGLLREKVGPRGRVVGIEESPQMAAVARDQIAREGWRNVTVVQVPAEQAEITEPADAALFCAVHDILQSPQALGNVLGRLRPGARVAAGGGKFAAPLMVALNVQARMVHAPYVRDFAGFHRPWQHLEQLVEDVSVRELALGTGYVMTGRAPEAAPAPAA
jgi:SAM-dependent methyltransferase